MKVTRVLLAATDNSIYWQFWNPISKVYKTKLGINPTLIWLGHADDMERLGLSKEHGDIIVQEPIAGTPIGWQAAWAIFYFMKFFPKDTFCTMGIDQVPLGPTFIREIIGKFYENEYVMLADDAYAKSHWETGGTSPTSFHICKGEVADSVYGFEKTFAMEIDKILKSGVQAYYDQTTKWGLDESYASHKLRQYRDDGRSIKSLRMFDYICSRRIECARVNETGYDDARLRAGWYGDAHLCRPVSDHSVYIGALLDKIPTLP